MRKIEKKRRTGNLILPWLLFVSYVLMVFLYWSKPLVMGLNLLLVLLFGYLLIFRKVGWKRDYIKWDAGTLVIRDGGVEYTYKWSDIDQVVFRKGHLHIKAGVANGYLMGLQGYSQNDLARLEQFLQSQPQESFTTN